MHFSGTIPLIATALGALVVATTACSSSDSETGTGTTTDAGTTTDSAITETDSGAPTTDSGTTPVVDAAADSNVGTPKEFGEPCDNDAQCKSNACFVGGNGSYCSIKCTPAGDVSTDCPTPLTSGECNNKGYCKK